jgi:hypothetical protein
VSYLVIARQVKPGRNDRLEFPLWLQAFSGLQSTLEECQRKIILANHYFIPDIGPSDIFEFKIIEGEFNGFTYCFDFKETIELTEYDYCDDKEKTRKANGWSFPKPENINVANYATTYLATLPLFF